MTTISATTILRSRNVQNPDHVLSTLLLRYPRWIHAEFMTHRQLSRNASSSRAIPVEKLIQDVLDDPAIPLYWGRNQKGMQAGEELNTHEQIIAEDRWMQALHSTVDHARRLAEIGCHKQIVNRVLEPFSHITVVVSATEWSNFLGLRDHADAEPHIVMLAREVRRCLEGEVIDLRPGEWHLPFVTDLNTKHLLYWRADDVHNFVPGSVKKSVACCASTSYKTVEGFSMTDERALLLHDKLVGSTPLHASPCEHVAQADWYTSPNFGEPPAWRNPNLHGNFIGFNQYRKMLPNESL